mgnify:CR=1 FL=1
MHFGWPGGTWGVPPDIPGHANGCLGKFFVDFRWFWGPFLGPLLKHYQMMFAVSSVLCGLDAASSFHLVLC